MFNAIVISYFMISGTIDIHSAIIGALFGVYIPDFCDAPLRSTSPRDFWSRRWNLLFRHVMHKSIFTELRRKGYNPIIGALLVCFASALLHEYMVWISCDGKPGWMTLFFVIHTTATIFETLLAKTLDPYMAHVPNIVKTAMFAMLMAMTAPLFMEPAQQCIPFMRWRLW
jgi:Na+-transporting NADH:ubiquinone oxidoreductase subunit NqrB